MRRILRFGCEKIVFHIKCTVYGKVYLVIIDSCGFENVVLMEMARKLNLKTVPHPNLYKLCWLQKRSEIKMETRCLVEFSLGSTKMLFGVMF